MREQTISNENETAGLIGSDKVEGTSVYDADGNHIGVIDRVMLEKVSGRVAYVVLSFGGFLGIGDDHYPLPWSTLKYNIALGGYQTMVPIDSIQGAPKYGRNDTWNWDDKTRSRALDDYYGVPAM